MSSTRPDPRRWWALGLIAIAQFLVIMDTSIIGVALPEIQRAIGFSPSELSWVFNAYVIAFGGLLLLGGRLADIHGPRRVFAAGFAILAGASLLTGLATGPEVLLVGRALQGAGSALIAPAALTMLMMLFSHDGRELTRAFAIYGAAAPAGGTAGVFLGGLLTEALDWRWVFLVNVPIALVVLALVRRVLPAGGGRRRSLDILGAVTATAALSLGVLGIVRAPEVGWTSVETIATLGTAVILGGLFLVLQARGREPLMPLAIWRVPDLAVANLAMALLGAAWVPAWFFLNLYLQQVMGMGAFEGGAALVPMTATIMVLMVGVTGRLVGRLGFRTPLVMGMLILAAGIAWLSRLDTDGTYLADVLPASLVAAGGMALAYIPAMLAALSGARPEDGGLASGIVNTTYQIGSAFGLAVMSAIAAANGAGSNGDPAALVDGYSAAFVAAAAVAAGGAIIAAGGLRRRAPRATAVTEPVTSEAVGMS